MKNAIEIRCIRENELGLLKDFLYEAIFVPEGVEPAFERYCRETGAARIH